jgi:hypothetical protein
MNTIPLHFYNENSIQLTEGGEIPFGPKLYSLFINQQPHALSKNTFLKNYCTTEDKRYVVLIDYRKEAHENHTRLVVLDLLSMTYSTVRESSGLITPISINEQIVIYTVENNGIKKEFEFPLQKLKWESLTSEISKLVEPNENIVAILQRYGYKAQVTSEGFSLRIQWTKKVLISLYLIAGFDSAFLVGFWLSDEVVRLVSGVMVLFLSAILIVSVLMHYLFNIKVNYREIHKNFLTKRSFAFQEIKKYIIKEEELLMPRSSKAESYSWHLFIELNNGKPVKLLHLNNRDKQQGTADMDATTRLFQKFIKAPMAYG